MVTSQSQAIKSGRKIRGYKPNQTVTNRNFQVNIALEFQHLLEAGEVFGAVAGDESDVFEAHAAGFGVVEAGFDGDDLAAFEFAGGGGADARGFVNFEAEAVAGTGWSRPAGTGGIFLCTSGTTGTPKGILLRDDQIGHVAAAVASHHRLSPADRGYCCLPLFHINAEVVGLLATLAARACLVLDRRFSRTQFWPLIETKRITWINAVPAIITVLAMDPDQPGPTAERVRSVRPARAAISCTGVRS